MVNSRMNAVHVAPKTVYRIKNRSGMVRLVFLTLLQDRPKQEDHKPKVSTLDERVSLRHWNLAESRSGTKDQSHSSRRRDGCELRHSCSGRAHLAGSSLRNSITILDTRWIAPIPARIKPEAWVR